MAGGFLSVALKKPIDFVQAIAATLRDVSKSLSKTNPILFKYFFP